MTVLRSDDVGSTLQSQKQVAELKEKSKEENWEAEQQKRQMQTMMQDMERIKEQLDIMNKQAEERGYLRPIDTEPVPLIKSHQNF